MSFRFAFTVCTRYIYVISSVVFLEFLQRDSTVTVASKTLPRKVMTTCFLSNSAQPFPTADSGLLRLSLHPWLPLVCNFTDPLCSNREAPAAPLPPARVPPCTPTTALSHANAPPICVGVRLQNTLAQRHRGGCGFASKLFKCYTISLWKIGSLEVTLQTCRC